MLVGACLDTIFWVTGLDVDFLHRPTDLDVDVIYWWLINWFRCWYHSLTDWFRCWHEKKVIHRWSKSGVYTNWWAADSGVDTKMWFIDGLNQMLMWLKDWFGWCLKIIASSLVSAFCFSFPVICPQSVVCALRSMCISSSCGLHSWTILLSEGTSRSKDGRYPFWERSRGDLQVEITEH